MIDYLNLPSSAAAEGEAAAPAVLVSPRAVPAVGGIPTLVVHWPPAAVAGASPGTPGSAAAEGEQGTPHPPTAKASGSAATTLPNQPLRSRRDPVAESLGGAELDGNWPDLEDVLTDIADDIYRGWHGRLDNATLMEA